MKKLVLLATISVLALTISCSKKTEPAAPKPAQAPTASTAPAKPSAPRPAVLTDVCFTLGYGKIKIGDVPSVRFTAALAPKAGEKYWITMVDAKAPDGEQGKPLYLEPGATAADLPKAEKTGDFEVRMHSGYPAKPFNIICRSPITVTK